MRLKLAHAMFIVLVVAVCAFAARCITVHRRCYDKRAEIKKLLSHYESEESLYRDLMHSTRNNAQSLVEAYEKARIAFPSVAVNSKSSFLRSFSSFSTIYMGEKRRWQHAVQHKRECSRLYEEYDRVTRSPWLTEPDETMSSAKCRHDLVRLFASQKSKPSPSLIKESPLRELLSDNLKDFITRSNTDK